MPPEGSNAEPNVAKQVVRILLQEHRAIEDGLARLEALLAAKCFPFRWTEADGSELGELVAVLQKETQDHVRREEEVLFPALEGFLPRQEGPLCVLRSEHQPLAAGLDRLRSSSEALHSGICPAVKLNELQSHSRAFIQLMRDHFYKEDRVLFPLIAPFLTAELDRALQRGLEAIGCSEPAEPAGDPCHDACQTRHD